jgi:hypothetical protein
MMGDTSIEYFMQNPMDILVVETDFDIVFVNEFSQVYADIMEIIGCYASPHFCLTVLS